MFDADRLASTVAPASDAHVLGGSGVREVQDQEHPIGGLEGVDDPALEVVR